MKRFLSFSNCGGLLFLAFLFSALPVHGADAFEGHIQMKVTAAGSADRPTLLNYTMKENKVRFDLPASGQGSHGKTPIGGMIMDYSTNEMITLMDMPGGTNGETKKMFMRHTIPQPKPSDDKPEMSDPVATGKSETIAGYKADEYKVTQKNGDISDLWLGRGLGNFAYPAGRGSMGRNAPSPAWEKFVREGQFFPLRVITWDKNGVEKSRMEVTNVDKTSVPDSTFSTEGYTEFSVPGLGKLLGQ